MYNIDIKSNDEIQNNFKNIWFNYFKSKLKENIYLIIDEFIKFIKIYIDIKSTRKKGIKNSLVNNIGKHLNYYFIINNLLQFTQSDFIWINYLYIKKIKSLDKNLIKIIDEYLINIFCLNLINNIKNYLPNRITSRIRECYGLLSEIINPPKNRNFNENSIKIKQKIEKSNDNLFLYIIKERKINFKIFQEFIENKDSKKNKIYSVILFIIIYEYKPEFFANKELEFRFFTFLDSKKTFIDNNELNSVIDSIGCISYYPKLSVIPKDSTNFRDLVNKIPESEYNKKDFLEEVEKYIHKEFSIYELKQKKENLSKMDIEKRNKNVIKFFRENQCKFDWLSEQ